jgi:hypothetical protein
MQMFPTLNGALDYYTGPQSWQAYQSSKFLSLIYSQAVLVQNYTKS